MKLDKTYLTEKISILVTTIKRFRFIFAFVIFSIMYSHILIRVNTINGEQPSEKKIQDQTMTAPRTQVDPKLVQKIISLEEQNVQIKTLFNQARNNPFAE